MSEFGSQNRFVGQELGGRYKIVSLLGEGGMGAVYVGEQKLGTTVRKVAIKTLHPHLSHDPKIIARFEREVGTIAELHNPHTIQVFDFGKTDDGTLYIVMEFLEGRSVGNILETEGPIPPERVQSIMSQVAESLDEAHSRGIVHRDLKPDNVVLVERSGKRDWVKVLDFGIAKKGQDLDATEQRLTQQGTVLGTPPYMSPEQFTGRTVDMRSDIYSLGVMAYEMLIGKLPFECNTAFEWASAHLTHSPAPFELAPLGAQVPETMRSAIMRALAKAPEDRFASAGEFAAAMSGAVVQPAPRAAATRPSTPPRPDAVVRTDPGVPSDGRNKTEVGQPIAAPGMAYGAPPYAGGAPTPQQFAVPVPNAPGAPSSSSRGLLIGGLAVVGGGMLVGALALAGVFKSNKPAEPISLGATAEPAPFVAPSVPTTAEPTPAATATDPGLPSLNTGGGGSSAPPSSGASGAKKDAGAPAVPPGTTKPPGPGPSTAPSTPPTAPPTTAPPAPTTPPAPTKPPVPAGPLAECITAKKLCDQKSSQCERMKRLCLSKGGTLP